MAGKTSITLVPPYFIYSRCSEHTDAFSRSAVCHCCHKKIRGFNPLADLYHLAYVSDVMLLQPDEEPKQTLVNSRLQSILETAAKNNQKSDVTGALLFSGRHFAQVLEGPEAAINDRFRLISQDTRHHNVTPLLYEPAGERQFKGWSMALCVPGDLDSPPVIANSKPSPGSVEAGNLGRGIVASLAAAIDKRARKAV